MAHIYDSSLRALLPSSIRDDKTIAASALALDPTLLASVHAIPNLLLYQRLLLTAGLEHSAMLTALERLTASAGGLAPLSTAELEHLAWQLHVDYRELATTDQELALMVVNSIAWHRIKGTPASIIQALAMFGIGASLEEHTCAHWATYQMEVDATTTDGIMTAYTVAKEMQPARCNLARIYSPWNDGRIIIHDTQSTWDEFYWDFESGVPVTMPDGTVITVSLGSNTQMLLEELPLRVLRHGHHMHPMRARWGDYWVWNHSYWGDHYLFPARICRENTYPIRLIGDVSLPSYVYRNAQCYIIASEINVADTTLILQNFLHTMRTSGLGIRWSGNWDSRTWKTKLPAFISADFTHSSLLEDTVFTMVGRKSYEQGIAGEINVADKTLILQDFVHTARLWNSLANTPRHTLFTHSYALEKTSSTAAMVRAQNHSLCARSSNASYAGHEFSKTIVTPKLGSTWTGNWDAQTWQPYTCFITKTFEYQE
ncbi:MAG: phage tail protein [Pseudomonadota bacterium]